MNMRPVLLVVAALAATTVATVAPGVSRAAGCTITWVGDVDGAWTTSGGGNTNWTEDRLPNASDQVCIDSGTVSLVSDVQISQYSIASGASLSVVGARLRATQDSTNAGTVTLSGANARLQTENGVAGDIETLTNTGTITSTGSGGQQGIAGDLVNAGTLTVGHELVTLAAFSDGRPPTLTNTGQLTVQTGARLLAGAATVRQGANGIISGPGTLDVDTSGRLEIAGGAIAASADVNAIGGSGNCCGNFPGAQLAFVGASGATGTVGVSSGLGGRHAVSGDVPAGFTVELESSGVLVANQSWTNAGTILLSGSGAQLLTENGVATDVETLTNTGTIALSGAGRQLLGGDVDNRGTLQVAGADAHFAATFENRVAQLVNHGTLTALAGGHLLADDRTKLVLGAGSTVHGPGTVEITGGSSVLQVSGGAVAADADVNVIGGVQNLRNGASLAFASAAGSTGTIAIAGHSGGVQLLSGDIPAGVRVDVEQNSPVTASAGFTNAGILTVMGSAARLNVEDGDPLTVETLTSTGTLIIGGGGTQTLRSNVVNSGTLTVDGANVFYARPHEGRRPTLTSSGTLTVTSGSLIYLERGVLDLLDNAQLGGSGTVQVTGDDGLVRVHAATIAPATNLELWNGFQAPGADLDLSDAAAATGKIAFTQGFNGEQRITGDVPAGVTLKGLANARRLRWTAPLRNFGTIDMDGDAGVEVTAGETSDPATLTNRGEILEGGIYRGDVVNTAEMAAVSVARPIGGGAGGNFTQTPAGRLKVVASNSSVTTLSAVGTATLDGELAIETIDPKPDPNIDQTAVSAGARRGTFANVAGRATGPWAILYQAPGVVLRGVAPGEFTDGPELTLDDATVQEGDSGTSNATFTAHLAQAPGHPVTVEWHTVDDSATSPSDFTESSGLLSFDATETTKSLTVPVKGDTDVEPAETFLVRLRGARGAGLGVARATGLIVADDLGILGSTPDHAGTGTATVTVRGGGFAPGTTVKLARPGRADVPGSVLFTDTGRSRMEVRFDLSEALVGIWDLVVTSAGGASATRPGALTVEPRRRARLEVSVSAPETLRFGFTGRGTVSLHNAGNVDAEVELITLTGGNLKLRLPGETAFADPPIGISESRLAKLLGGVPILPGGATRQFGVRFQSTSDVAHTPLTIRAEAIDRDFLDDAIRGGLPEAVTGHITGRLVTPAGDPVGGVQVGAVTPRGQRGDSASDVTGADGGFDLGPLGDATYLVAAGSDPRLSADPASVAIDAAHPAPSVTLTRAIARVAGTVRRPDGTRVGGARVTLRSGGARLATVRTDGAGAYAFAVVASGAYSLRAVSSTAGIAGRDVTVDVGSAATGLTLTTGDRALAVTVSGPGGPVDGALVSAREAGQDTGPQRRTGPDGVASFAGLPGGALTVEAAAAGLAPAGVELGGGVTSAALALGTGARIEGDLDAAGEPVDAAAAIAVARTGGRERRGYSRPDGRYAITGLAAGTYDVWLAAPGRTPKLVEGVDVGAGATQTLDATLDDAGATREVTLEAPDGSPARGARFTVRHVATGVQLLSTFAGGDGVAKIGPLPAGNFVIEGELPGGAPVTQTLAIARDARRRAPDTLGRWVQQQLPQPGVKGTAREIYYLENPPETSWFDGTTEPTPLPYDLANGYNDYLKISVNPPCEYGYRLVRLLDVKRHVINDLYQNYHKAWVDMDQANNQQMAGYLVSSAKLAGDIMTLGRLSQAQDAVERAGDFAGALDSQLKGLGETVAGSVISGELPSSRDIAEQLQTAAETLRQLDDPTDLRKFGDGTQRIAAANALRDILKLKEEADKFPEDVRQRGDAFRDAQAKYLNALVASKQMTVELQRIVIEDCPEDPTKPKPPPRQPGPGATGGWLGDLLLSNDPNDILGPAGVGSERWVPSDQALAYTVRFENQPTASAPAVLVAVETTLDPDVDLDAFALGDLGWGSVTVPVPPGRQSFHADMPQAGGDVVRVDAELDRATRTVRWELASIDPVTGEVEEAADAGFLPPEDGTHRGQGFVTYDTRATGAAHGTEIAAQARIVFDRNVAIDTPVHRNTIDDVAPASAVTGVAQAPGPGCSDDLAVTWSGTDTGAGVDTYDVWVSTDATPFVPWLTATSETGGTYPGVAGHDYAFFSVARDKVGQLEAAPASGDKARTATCDRAAPSTLLSVVGGTPAAGYYPGPVEVRIDGVDAPGGSGVNRIAWTATGAAPGTATVDDDATTVPVGSDGATTVEATSRDAAGNESKPSHVEVKIDSKAPEVTIGSPAEGAQVALGSGANAAFSCTDAGSGIDTCTGTTANGSPIDTGALGARALTVTAKDKLGRQTEVTRYYTVVAGAGPEPSKKPVTLVAGAGPKLSKKPVTLALGKLDRKGVARLVVRNREAFAIKATLRVLAAKGTKTIAKGTKLSLPKQAKRTVKLRFANAVRRSVKRGRTVRVRLRVAVTGPAGDKRTVTVVVRLKQRNG